MTAPRVLRPSKTVVVVLAVLSVAMQALAAGFALSSPVLWVILALLVPVSLLMQVTVVRLAWPGNVWLRLDDVGLTVKYGRRVDAFAWGEIERVCLAPEGRSHAVGLCLVADHPKRSRHGAGADLTLGTHWELAAPALLEEVAAWHARARGARRPWSG